MYIRDRANAVAGGNHAGSAVLEADSAASEVGLEGSIRLHIFCFNKYSGIRMIILEN